MEIDDEKIWKNKLAEVYEQSVPPVGHEKKFEQRLIRRESKRLSFHRRAVTWATVSIAASLVIAFVLTKSIFQETGSVPISSEVSLVSDYYEKQLDEEIERIRTFLPILEDKVRSEISCELERVCRERDTFVRLEWNGLTEENQIAFLIMCYQRQLFVLRMISGQLLLFVEY